LILVARATRLRRRRKISLGDAIIAAKALVQGVALATANVEDFAWIDEFEGV
jgi:predicted nucleic acid-binding protein